MKEWDTGTFFKQEYHEHNLNVKIFTCKVCGYKFSLSGFEIIDRVTYRDAPEPINPSDVAYEKILKHVLDFHTIVVDSFRTVVLPEEDPK